MVGMDCIYRSLLALGALYVYYDEALGGSYKVTTTISNARHPFTNGERVFFLGNDAKSGASWRK